MQHTPRFTILIMLGLSMTVAAVSLPAQDAARGRNKRLFVVPTPGRVVVDGQLDDWDLTGSIYTCVDDKASAARSARLAAMYDGEAFYLGGEVNDSTPMINRNDPISEGNKGWNADALQFRFLTDPKRGHPVWGVAARFLETHKKYASVITAEEMVTLTLWYFTDKQLPCLNIQRGLTYELPKADYAKPHGVIPNDKYQAVYRQRPDGKGYLFEYRIPWKELDMERPFQAGDLVPGTFQLNWGTPSGIGTPRGAWDYDLQVSLGFPWQSTESYGKLIFAPHGHLMPQLSNVIRPVLRNKPLSFSYNLLRDSEVSLMISDDKGQVRRHLLAQAPRKAGEVIEQWDGLDDDGAVMPAGEYSWRGIRFDPIRTEYVMGVNNAGNPTYLTEDGAGSWGGDHGMPSAVCTAGSRVILSWDCTEGGSGIIGCDQEGRKLWGIGHDPAEQLASDGERIFFSGGSFNERFDEIKVISATDGRSLSFSKTGRNTAFWDPTRKTTPRVNGLAYGANRLYASFAADNRIVQYNADTGEVLAVWELPLPGHLAMRPDGVLLAVSGSTVIALDSAGKPTPLVRDHLDSPTGIALDSKGNLYVANRGALQNVSVFSANGNYVRSIGKPGGRPRVGAFDAGGMLEPYGIAMDKQNRLWVAEMEDAPKRISVWDTTAGKPLRDFYGAMHYTSFGAMDAGHPDELINDGVVWKVDLATKTYQARSTMYRASDPAMLPGLPTKAVVNTALNGRQFALCELGLQGNPDRINTIMIRDKDIFKPLCAVIGIGRNKDFPLAFMKHDAAGTENSYLWYDGNGDQRVQREELTPTSALGDRKVTSFLLVDKECNLWGSGFVVRPSEFKPDGTPVYDFRRMENTKIAGAGTIGTSLVRDPVDHGFYTLKFSSRSEPLKGQLLKLSPQGEVLWRYPWAVQSQSGLTFAVPDAGRPYGITGMLQMQGDFLGLGTWTGSYHLFTRDGLYVAQLFRDQRLGEMGPDSLAWEIYGGTLFKEQDGSYLLCGGDTDARITRIRGLETVTPLTGTLTITPKDVESVNAADGDYNARMAHSQTLFIARGRQSLNEIEKRGVIPAIGLTRKLDGTHAFTAHVARDENSLYLLLKVNSPADFTTLVTDAEKLADAGNVLDLQIATDPVADPKRRQPANGDVRLLVSRSAAGKPLGCVQRVKNGKAESFTVGDKLSIVQKTTGSGFETTVTVPLELLGWTPLPAETVRMDLGYRFGNADGTRCEQEGYWFHNSAVKTAPKSVMDPAVWGCAVVE